MSVNCGYETKFISMGESKSSSLNTGNFALTNLRVLVTGGGSGIGKAIADGMKNAGAKVVVCDANDTTNPNYICDVSKTSDVEAMFAVSG